MPPTQIGPGDFRALASSAPWLFRTLHASARDDTGETEFWLRRPGLLVRRRDGEPREVVRHEVGEGMAVLVARSSSGSAGQDGVDAPGGSVEVPSPRGPLDIEPPRRPDGLVLGRPRNGDPHEEPWGWLDVDEPSWGDSYLEVAALDPFELAHGVEVTDVREVEQHGRVAWAARCVARVGYEPRCSCCPLLWSRASDDLEAQSGGAPFRDGEPDYPAGYEVVLDRQTGIVVRLAPVGGTPPHPGFEVSIHAVDVELDDALFVPEPRQRWFRRG